MNITEAINKIWGSEPVEYEPLNGGFVNATYKVTAAGNNYALRLNGAQNDFLGLSREKETVALKTAGELSIAPHVLPQTTPEYLLTEFIDAKILTNEDFKRRETIAESMRILKVIHGIDGSGIGRRFSRFDMLDKYMEGIRSLNVAVPADMDGFLREVGIIRTRRERESRYCTGYCHNDFFGFNILNGGGRLYVIDWELSGEGDIFFDLASLPYCHAFTPEQERHMLECYLGAAEPEHLASLRDMKYVNMVAEAAWGFLHSGMGEESVNHGLDYYRWGLDVTERIRKGILYI